jgi:uncharacterized protein
VATHTSLQQLLIDAAREFNAGRYFEAHEVLEDGLDRVPEELWNLFTGLIQVAVGYHKATQQLWNGAAAMLERAMEKIETFPDDAAGLNLEALRRRIRSDVESIRTGTFDLAVLARMPPRMQPGGESRGT